MENLEYGLDPYKRLRAEIVAERKNKMIPNTWYQVDVVEGQFVAIDQNLIEQRAEARRRQHGNSR